MKELNFKEWLESQGVDTKEFWEQCKMKNQGWESIRISRKDLESLSPRVWIDSFKWSSTEQGHIFWEEINAKWRDEIEEYEINNEFNKIEFGFGKETK